MKKINYCIDCGILIWQNSKRCISCTGKQTSKRQKGKNNHNYKNGKSKCIECGIELESYKAKRCPKCHFKRLKILLKNRSIDWKNKISKTMLTKGTTKGKNNPMFGKISHGKGTYYQNIWMRSSYEIAFAKWLDNQSIEWLYEPKVFYLKNCTYRPDFYLPETNEYIEIKGYWRDDAKKKFEIFKKKYKDIKIKILNHKLLKSMEVI